MMKFRVHIHTSWVTDMVIILYYMFIYKYIDILISVFIVLRAK